MLDKDFWESNSSKILPTMFGDDLRTVYETVVEAHGKYGRNLTVEELRALHRINNPTLTTAARSNIEELFLDIENCDPPGPDVAQDVLQYMWKQETFRELADYALKGMDGKLEDLMPIQRILETRGEDFIPLDEYSNPVPRELEEILDQLADRNSWEFNIDVLHRRVAGICGGDFMVAMARPEVGKTAFHVSLACAPGGWVWQGANVVVFANEEPGNRTKMRAIQAATQMTKDEIMADIPKAKRLWDQVKHRYEIIDFVNGSIAKIDNYCKKFKPDIVIVDQLDKVHVPGSFGATHERLREVYVQAREIAKRHNVGMVGINQASAEAEGKTRVTYAMMEGSKTGKAAEADIIIGVGKMPQEEGTIEEDFTRYLTVSKNKLTGWHGTEVCMLDGPRSTYRA